ncbi:MAG: tetratricopeptide repeat protein [Chloroflexi bacterium]|nr:tetratricopeptide repeat protein [Chloroflexota bacterium]
MNQKPLTAHQVPIHGSHNLPVQVPDTLFGRDSDLAAIHLSLKAGTSVLLHGPDGVGKTTLAAALANGYAELPGGVLWFEGHNDALPALLNRFLRAYANPTLTRRSSLDELTGIVRSILQEHRPLVVLDGQVNSDAVREFVRECTPGVPVILTHTGLLPGPWTPFGVSLLETEDAQTMLIEQAGEGGDFDLSSFARLAEAVDGNPLAIHVAGSLLATGTVTAEQFLAKIPDTPDGKVNQLMSALTAAYRLLPGKLQGLALLLGASFGPGGSEELLSDVSGAPVPVIQAAMRQLVVRGLAIERSVYDQPYFVMHNRVKAFAQTFLRGKNQFDAMRTRHWNGLLAYVQRHTATDNPAHQSALVAEADTVLTAALDDAGSDQLMALVELLQTGPAQDFAQTYGFQQEFAWLADLVEQPEAAETGVLGTLALEEAATPVVSPALEALLEDEPEPSPELAPAEPASAEPEPVLPVPEPPTTAQEAQPLAEKLLEMDMDSVHAAPDEPVPPAEPDEADEPEMPDIIAELQEQDTVAAEAIFALAEDDVLDEMPPARPLEAAAAMVPTPTGVEDAQPTPVSPAAPITPVLPETSLDTIDFLQQFVDQTFDQGATTETITHYTEALATYKADGNVEDELAALEALAALNLEAANYDEVLDYVDQGMALAQEAHNPQREGHLLVVLGDLQASLGRYDGAQAAYAEAVSAFQPLDAWLDMGVTLNKLGDLYLNQGQPQDAQAVLEQALPVLERIDHRAHRRVTLELLGDTHTELMNVDIAADYYRQALTLAQELDDQEEVYDQLYKLGMLQEGQGQLDRALTLYRQALHVAFQIDAPGLTGDALLALGRLLVNDTAQLNRVVQLLDGASERLPGDPDVQRLLKRAKTRQQRLTAAGVVLAPAESGLQDYAVEVDIEAV